MWIWSTLLTTDRLKLDAHNLSFIAAQICGCTWWFMGLLKLNHTTLNKVLKNRRTKTHEGKFTATELFIILSASP
jgi:hypothetical protein